MTLANCLNLPCRTFKQFACFSDAFKSSLKKKKKDSVKYFNKPKPCGIFFRCLNCTPLTPVHPPTLLFWLAFSQHFFFFQCLSICYQSVGFVTSAYLWVRFPPSNCFNKAHTHTQTQNHFHIFNKSFCCGNL